ncbi:ferredoxin [Intrasporangium oryzae NRRL B-24470]|uniref:Ferredoxin n=1 Tax=Intrasporangium oryzae NRRL B-24470 TaxID=1386089 RepID=W9G884_9MICO|nr:ferredoxin [Intrasporangium oryzae]EWT00059.1 ferredoxin [Intrasporangium oryzae NRRL B-24470]
MKIIVDLNLCQDHGQCAIAAPAVFRMNDDGKLEYEEIAEESRRAEVEEAADVCPVQAILIEG